MHSEQLCSLLGTLSSFTDGFRRNLAVFKMLIYTMFVFVSAYLRVPFSPLSRLVNRLYKRVI